MSYAAGKGTVLACIEWGYYLDAMGVVSFYPAKPKAHTGIVPEVAAAAERWDALPGTMKANISR